MWAFYMMGRARLEMPKVPDIGFWKLCGSGTGEGFTPIPNTAVYAILAAWPDAATARERTAHAAIFQTYRRHAEEDWTVILEAATARGVWSGRPFDTTGRALDGPLAVLTRATVKPTAAWRFWRHSPGVSQMIGADPNVTFKIGIGEVPLLHQVTFSIWPDTRSMAQFARDSGAHATAVRAVRNGNWFAEELYARFAILGEHGSWGGASPLAKLDYAA